MEDFLYAKGLCVGYGGRPLLRDLELHVRPGEIVTLIGPNGAGKSTILKTIIKELCPLGGAVYLGGAPLERMTEREAALQMSVLMTGKLRPELMTCFDVAAAGRYPHTGRFGILSEEDRNKTKDALRLVGAKELAGRYFGQVSDGQRQKVLLARAICQEPRLIVLDEPTSFLDLRHKLELLTILKTLVREKDVAVLMSLHELDLAERISDFVVCIRDGAVGKAGTPEEIFTSEYISELYGLAGGSYDAELGCPEMEPVKGTPRVFVIGGGGSGIPVYRRLWRQGIPFAAGVLHENDVEYRTAKALAAEVIAERAFEPIGDEAFARAVRRLESCERVICCLKEFGTMNERNRELSLRCPAEKLLDKFFSGAILKNK